MPRAVELVRLFRLRGLRSLQRDGRVRGGLRPGQSDERGYFHGLPVRRGGPDEVEGHRWGRSHAARTLGHPRREKEPDGGGGHSAGLGAVAGSSVLGGKVAAHQPLGREPPVRWGGQHYLTTPRRRPRPA